MRLGSGWRRSVALVLGAALAIAITVAAVTIGASAHPFPRAATTSLPKPVRLARADAAKRRHVKVSRVRVVRVTHKTWPDGCLGLPRHGEMCSQIVTAGYRATFAVGAHKLVYRTDRHAAFRRESG